MELQNTLRDLFAGRRQPNVRLGAIENIIRNEPEEVVEIIDPAILPDVPAPEPAPIVEEEKVEEEEKEPEYTCTVCLEELTAENTHELRCGHKAVCKDCHPMMMTQNVGNGCVGEDPETCVKVIKCPICRREDMPTREQLIAEIVRIRRGGYFRRLAPAPAPLPVPVPQHHNLPAVIPVLHPQPAPAIAQANLNHAVQQFAGAVRAPRARAPRVPRAQVVAPVAPVAQAPIPAGLYVRDGNWLQNQNFIPRRANGADNEHELNHLPQHYPILANLPNDIARWNILRGHQFPDAQVVGQYLNAGQRVAGGFVCGEAGRRRFYHAQFFIPEETEGNVPTRRLCNNANCEGNHRSRTARRCPKGCGQFICQACNHCHINECRNQIY